MLILPSDGVSLPLAVNFRDFNASVSSSLNKHIVETDLGLSAFVQNVTDPIQRNKPNQEHSFAYLIASSMTISVSK